MRFFSAIPLIEDGKDVVGERSEQIIGQTLARGPNTAFETNALPKNAFPLTTAKNLKIF